MSRWKHSKEIKISFKSSFMAFIGIAASAQPMAQAAPASTRLVLSRAAIQCSSDGDAVGGTGVILGTRKYGKFCSLEVQGLHAASRVHEHLPVYVQAMVAGAEFGVFQYVNFNQRIPLTRGSLLNKSLQAALGTYQGVAVGATCLFVGMECTLLRNANGAVIRDAAFTMGQPIAVTASYMNLSVNPKNPTDPRWSMLLVDR